MKLNTASKDVIVNLICYLYILLFVYASVSKLLDFENFQLQLAQSPLITAYAGFISRAVLILEMIIALLLSIPRLRLLGMLASFGLMVLFTTYIYIILHYSSFVPCSCGGILEKMDWTTHMVFNSGFILLSILAVYLMVSVEKRARYYASLRLLFIGIFAILLMVLLFMSSENFVHHRNNFVRQFPPLLIKKVNSLDLQYNSYYFAGSGGGKIYLGNVTAPSVVTEIDTALKYKKVYHIQIKGPIPQFRSVQVRVLPPYFYVIDGSVSCIFRGKINDWKADLVMENSCRFSFPTVIDSTTITFRTLSKENENLLGILDFKGNPIVVYHPELLQKQMDGVFDTDGILQYDIHLKRFVYLYYYRNQFIVTDPNLELIDRGHTIDTTTQAQLKITYLKNRNQKKFAAPPYTVNRLSSVRNKLLFVNSLLPGRYDPMIMWNDASIIDVYDFTKNSYLMSFYLYKVDGKPMDRFIVTETHLLALFDHEIISYRFRGSLKEALAQPINIK